MIKTQIISYWRFYTLMSIMTCCLVHSVPAMAQRILYDSTIDKLKTSVHLALGETTAAQVAAALSTQTGLKIEATDYLKDRILDVELDHMTCTAALNAIAELNEWKWEEIGVGHIVFTRRVPPVPQKIVDIPAAMLAALPKDWRTYLYIDVPWQEAMRASGTTSTHFGPRSVQEAMGIRIARLMNRQLETIVGSLKPPLGPDSKYPYSGLSPEQRDALIRILFLLVMNETSNSLLHGHLSPYEIDFSRAVIEIRGSDLLIGTHWEEGENKRFDYFGVQIIGPYALPQ